MFKEFRRYKRYSISVQTVVRRLDKGSPETLTAQITSISQGGVGFYTKVLIEKAVPVSVELLFNVLKGIRKNIEGRIVSICSLENDYFVGVAFDREISYDSFLDIIG